MVKLVVKYFRPFFLYIFILGLAFVIFHIDHGPTIKTVNKSLLNIYAYSSFASAWGAGPKLKEMFEAECRCSVELTDAGDSGIILQKLRYELGNVDLILGMDQMTIGEALKTLEWHVPSDTLLKDIKWDPIFEGEREKELIPFDWSPLTFVYKKGGVQPPKSLDDLLDKRFEKKITLQDPRTSNLGFQLLYWLISDRGEAGAYKFFHNLRHNIFSMSPSWTTSYGLFQQGQASVTFSYLTSLIYHWQDKKSTDQIEAASFEGGHPYQVEYVGIPKSASNKELAEKFIEFLLSEKAQEVILSHNFMLPVIKMQISSETQERLPKLKSKTLNYKTLSSEKKKLWLGLWKEVW